MQLCAARYAPSERRAIIVQRTDPLPLNPRRHNTSASPGRKSVAQMPVNSLNDLQDARESEAIDEGVLRRSVYSRVKRVSGGSE